jgi:hypothetical protein
VTPATWRNIRALRAEPAGLAEADESRGKTFSAALRQAQELAEAASAVSYAARPLPLFYALSQAGRAISAARSTGDWRIRSHGMGCSLDDGAPVLTAELTPAKSDHGAFRRISTATGSPLLGGPTQLGALWAANPDLAEVPIPGRFGDWPVALTADLGIRPNFRSSIDHPTIKSHTTGGFVTASIPLRGDTAARVLAAAVPYPSLADAQPLKEGVMSLRSGGVAYAFADGDDQVVRDQRTSHPVMALPADRHMTPLAFWRLRNSLYSFVEPALTASPSYPNHVGHVVPALAGSPAPAPLMLWWALLLGLSSLARYRPSEWVAAIDVDSSTLGYRLEQLLDVAAVQVPLRIWDALAH